MKFSRSNFDLMRWSIAALSASVLLSGIILYASNKFANHADRDFRTVTNQMRDARSRLNNAYLDRDYLATYARDYAALEKREVLGDERRLDWMEGLDRLSSQPLVIGFTYTIAPQQSFAPQPALDSGSFDINYSEMKLQFELLHEGQLLDFFTALRQQIRGQYLLEGCSLQRTTTDTGNTAEEPAPSATNVTAECVGGWISLRNRNAQS
ncbi:MAG TPA: hypothetical protein VGD24_05850 [Gallionella sp.]